MNLRNTWYRLLSRKTASSMYEIQRAENQQLEFIHLRVPFGVASYPIPSVLECYIIHSILNSSSLTSIVECTPPTAGF